MKRKYIVLFLTVFLLADIAFSVVQYHNKPIAGDLIDIILPAPWYSRVLQDPTGTEAITGEPYAGAGRFFCHWWTERYYKTAPLFLQRFVSPISSIYLAGAIVRSVTHLLFLFLLAYIVSGRFRSRDLLLAAVLISPLIQASGKLYTDMALVDSAVNYTFFYGFPLSLLLLYLTPFLRSVVHGRPFSLAWYHALWLLPLAVVLAFSSPLVQPLVLFITATAFGLYFWQGYMHTSGSLWHRIIKGVAHIPRVLWWYLGGFSLLCLYGYYVGLHNTENINNDLVPLGERYLKLFHGLLKMFTRPWGYPLLVTVVALNCWLLNRVDNARAAGLRKMIGVLAVFCLVYILLLPLGGYRAYRPDIVRYDTLIPVTLSLMFAFGASALLLLQNLTIQRPAFIGFTVVVLAVYLVADGPRHYDYRCERGLIETLASTDEPVAKLPKDCYVMAWDFMDDPQRSHHNMVMLHYWNVTGPGRLYYQE